MRHLAIVVLASLIVTPASAMIRVASDGRATVSEIEVLVEPDAWIIRARLDGNAGRVALLLPVPHGAVQAEVTDGSQLDRLDYATSPRMKVVEAHDPCAELAGDGEVTPFWPARKTDAAPGFSAEVLAPQRAVELSIPGVSLDDESKRALARAVRDGGRIAALIGPAPGKLRGFWTPPLKVNVKSRSLPVGFAAPHVTVGADLRVHIYTRESLAPAQKTADLPSNINLPEVTFEAPLDLLRAAAKQTIRREGGGAAIRIHSGDVQRWYVEVGRRDEDAVVKLAEQVLLPFAGEWWIRRVWREPLACAQKARYLETVRIQQKTELQTYAAVTGRPQSTIRTLMKERGYLLENGKLRSIQVRAPR